MGIALWLDDVRIPPDGWVWAKTVADAKTILLTGQVQWASLDHDLGTCPDCNWLSDQDVDERICPKECWHECHETGSQLVDWMEANDVWPATKPRVHSSNPVGAAYMRLVIERKWNSG